MIFLSSSFPLFILVPRHSALRLLVSLDTCLEQGVRPLTKLPMRCRIYQFTVKY